MKPWHVVNNQIQRCPVAMELDSDLEAVGQAFVEASNGDASAQWAILTCYDVEVMHTDLRSSRLKEPSYA